MLHINDLTYRIGGRILFDHTSLHIAAGQRVGLVGRNGSGKSTLFRLIAGEISPDDGGVNLRVRARLGRVAQHAPTGETSLIDCVLAADEERTRLLAEAETETDSPHLAEIHERLSAIEAHGAPARAAAILAGLGFDEAAQARAVGSFSGGWRMRVALAAALFSRPDLLLLDEPTNHLDLEATIWLEGFLASYLGTLIVISHDRALLDKVAERIVHVEGMRLNAYGGNYTRFEQARRERLAVEAKTLTKQLEQRRKIQAFVDRFRAKATKARQAQSRLKMLERMETPVSVVEDKPIVFEFPDPEPLSPPLIQLENVAVGYTPERPILKGLDLRIDMDDRIALLGANGNGKTTLSRLLAGRLAPQAGQLRKSSKLVVGYFAQDQADELQMHKSAYLHLQERMGQAPEAKVRAHLGRFGFSQDRADIRIENLSGGERARLLLALMSREAPHVMVLDEPTNHLDIDSREALVAALNAYEGAVVLVSHDPHLVELAADRLWLVADGQVKPFDGDLDDYRRLLLEASRTQKRAGNAETNRPSRKDQRRSAAERRAEHAPLRQAAKAAEKLLESLSAQKEKLEAKLADPALYQGDSAAKAAELKKSLADVERLLERAEEDWLLAHEALAEAEAD